MKTRRIVKESFFVLVVIVLCCGIFAKKVNAASYPSIFPEDTAVEACVGESVEFKYNYFPKFTNEKIIVNVINSDGEIVATSESSMYNTSISTVPYTVTWDAENIEAGEYKVEATLLFYTMYEWRENPTKRTIYLTLNEHDYEEKITQTATTERKGQVTYTCSNCGDKYKETVYKISSTALSKTTYVYNGSVKNPTVTIKDTKGNKLIKGKDYTVKYASGRKNVGTYKVTITFKGKYKGTKVLSFKVNPKVTSVKSLTKGVKQFTAKWNKVSSQATGYEIMYATNSAFSKNKKIVDITSFKTTSKKITGLKANTKYYVKIRTYKTVNGTKYYSSWSEYKTVTTNSANSPKLRVTTKTLKCGATYTQKLYTSKGKEIDTSKLEFSSSNKKVATVNSKGLITAKKPGTATITVKYNDNSYKAEITVKSRITISQSKVEFNNMKSKKIKITLDDTAFETCEYISWDIVGDEDIVECEWNNWNGNSISLTVTPLEIGTTKIKISHDGKGGSYDYQYITVSVEPVKIIIPQTPITINEYDYSGKLTESCKVTNIYYTIEKSGSEYYFELYFDGKKTYGSSTTASSCSIGYQLLKNGAVVESDTVYSSSVFKNQKFVGAYDNGFLDAGTYELVLLNVK